MLDVGWEEQENSVRLETAVFQLSAVIFAHCVFTDNRSYLLIGL